MIGGITVAAVVAVARWKTEEAGYAENGLRESQEFQNSNRSFRLEFGDGV